MRDLPADVFFGLMRSLAFVTLYRDEYEAAADHRYSVIHDALITAVAKGLTTGVSPQKA